MYSKDYGLPVARVSKEQIVCDITTKVNKTDRNFLILNKAPIFTSYVEVVSTLLILVQASSVCSIVMAAWNNCGIIKKQFDITLPACLTMRSPLPPGDPRCGPSASGSSRVDTPFQTWL